MKRGSTELEHKLFVIERIFMMFGMYLNHKDIYFRVISRDYYSCRYSLSIRCKHDRSNFNMVYHYKHDKIRFSSPSDKITFFNEIDNLIKE